MSKNYLWECTINDYHNINDIFLRSELEKHHVFESTHITNIFDDAVKSIFDKIFGHFNSISLKTFEINPITNREEFYTGWNLIPKHNSVDEPYTINANDSSIDFPIYLLFYYKRSETEFGLTKYRRMSEIVENNTSVNIYKNKILILINAFIFEILINEDKVIFQAVIEETVAHEMQHAYDMYIFKDYNWLDNKKNSILKDFRENVFNLDPNGIVYNYIDDVCSLISRPEVRGRLKGYSTFLSTFKQTKMRLMNLVSDVLRMIPYDYFSNCSPEERKNKIHKLLVMCVLRDLKASDCVLLKSYNRIIYNLLMDKVTDNELILLILGYYMQHHEYFKFNTRVIKDYHIKTDRIRKFFSFDNIKYYIENRELLYEKELFDDVLFLIKFQLESEYLRYLNLIYNETDNHLEDLFSDISGEVIPRLKLKKREYFDLSPVIQKILNRKWFYEDKNIKNHQQLYEQFENAFIYGNKNSSQ